MKLILAIALNSVLTAAAAQERIYCPQPPPMTIPAVERYQRPIFQHLIPAIMKLKDLPDNFTPEQFRQLDKESLDSIPYTRMRWLCQCKGCKNGTRVRDYGLTEFNEMGIWAFLDRNSKYAAKNPHDYWMGPNNYWLCSKHNALFKRLKKRFDFEHVWRRFIDVSKVVVVPDPKWKPVTTVEQIERPSK